MRRSCVKGRPGKIKSVWLDELGTNVLSLEYDFVAGSGRVYLPDDCCVDMTGAIELFKRIDPSCRKIETYAGGRPDTAYLLGDDEWQAAGRAVMNVLTQALTDGLDELVHRLEQKWGIGRLRLLVDDDLRTRFDEQKRRLSYALADGDEEQIATQTMGMKRGWQALDQAAIDAGAEPLAPEVWECPLPNGELVALVRTEAEAQQVCRDVEVYTLAEVGQMIEKLGKDIRQVKTTYPGAAVAEIRDPEPPLMFSKEQREQYIAELAARFTPDEEIPF